jgi:hypothetical protein
MFDDEGILSSGEDVVYIFACVYEWGEECKKARGHMSW